MAMLPPRCGASVARSISNNATKKVLLARNASFLSKHAAEWRPLGSIVGSAPASSGSMRRSLLQDRRHFAAVGSIIEEKVPGFGAESITEGTIMEIAKKVGDGVTKGEVICTIETDKVTVEVNALESGIVKEIIAKVDDTVEVGATLMKVEVGDAPTGAPAAASTPAPAPSASATSSTPEIDLSKPVVGFRAGLLRAAAIRAGKLPAAEPPSIAPAPVVETPTAAGTTKVAATGRGDRRVPMSLVRKIVATRLKDAQNNAALLTTFQEVDMTAVLEVRSKYKELFEKTHGHPLGFLSMYVKACSLALQELPGVNALIDDATGEIVYRDYCDISVPIPSPRGIISCTIENVESLSVKGIESKLSELMTKARKDEITLEDMAPPTFGITDSGSAGGMSGTAIINPPMSALMGTNAIVQRAAVINGKVMARPIMYTSLTYDHRLIDGRESVTFLVSVRDKMEDPIRILLDL